MRKPDPDSDLTHREAEKIYYYEKAYDRAFELFEQYSGTCYYCGKKFDRLIDDGVEIDHAIPKSRGGDDDIGNMVISCSVCNVNKSIRTPEELKALVNRLSDEPIDQWPGDKIDIKFEKKWKKYQESGVLNSSEFEITKASKRLQELVNED